MTAAAAAAAEPAPGSRLDDLEARIEAMERLIQRLTQHLGNLNT